MVIYLDDNLLWSKQNKPTNHVATKLNQATGILSKLRNSIPQDSKDDISFSFLFPPIVWVSTIGPIKYNQPKQNTETSKQSLEKNIIVKKARFYHSPRNYENLLI